VHERAVRAHDSAAVPEGCGTAALKIKILLELLALLGLLDQ
jgi:hypothetical protein